jgi:hypothetical protein
MCERIETIIVGYPLFATDAREHVLQGWPLASGKKAILSTTGSSAASSKI